MVVERLGDVAGPLLPHGLRYRGASASTLRPVLEFVFREPRHEEIDRQFARLLEGMQLGQVEFAEQRELGGREDSLL